MSEIQGHTPGPWRVERPYIRGAGRVIASLESGRNEVEDTANARLIAAAPELYETLMELYKALVIEEISSETRTRACLRGKAVCAKVRGDEGEGR